MCLLYRGRDITYYGFLVGAVSEFIDYADELGTKPTNRLRGCVYPDYLVEKPFGKWIGAVRETLKERLGGIGAAVYTRFSGSMLVLTVLLPDGMEREDVETAAAEAVLAVPEDRALCVATVGAAAVPGALSGRPLTSAGGRCATAALPFRAGSKTRGDRRAATRCAPGGVRSAR